MAIETFPWLANCSLINDSSPVLCLSIALSSIWPEWKVNIRHKDKRSYTSSRGVLMAYMWLFSYGNLEAKDRPTPQSIRASYLHRGAIPSLYPLVTISRHGATIRNQEPCQHVPLCGVCYSTYDDIAPVRKRSRFVRGTFRRATSPGAHWRRPRPLGQLPTLRSMCDA